MPQLLFEKIHPDAPLPQRLIEHDAGFDVCAFGLTHTGNGRTWIIPPHETVTIPTGLLIAPPFGYAVLVLSRSSLAQRSLIVANAPGLVDPGYRGELKIILHNMGYESQSVRSLDRIAQLLLFPVVKDASCKEGKVDPGETKRGAAGFGSTGR